MGSGKVFSANQATRLAGLRDSRAFESFLSHSAPGMWVNWQMTDGVITMRHVVQLADGTQNLDVVTFTPLSKELIVSAYVLK